MSSTQSSVKVPADAFLLDATVGDVAMSEEKEDICLNCKASAQDNNNLPAHFVGTKTDLGFIGALDDRFKHLFVSVSQQLHASIRNPTVVAKLGKIKPKASNMPLLRLSDDFMTKALPFAFLRTCISASLATGILTCIQSADVYPIESRQMALLTKLLLLCDIDLDTGEPIVDGERTGLKLTCHLQLLRQLASINLEARVSSKITVDPSTLGLQEFDRFISGEHSNTTDAHKPKRGAAAKWSSLESSIWRAWALQLDIEELILWLKDYIECESISRNPVDDVSQGTSRVRAWFAPPANLLSSDMVFKKGWLELQNKHLPLIVPQIVLHYYANDESRRARCIASTPAYLRLSVLDKGPPYPFLFPSITDMAVVRGLASLIGDGGFVNLFDSAATIHRMPRQSLAALFSQRTCLPPCMRLLFQRFELPVDDQRYAKLKPDHHTRYFIWKFLLSTGVTAYDIVKWARSVYHGKEDITKTIVDVSRQRDSKVRCLTMANQNLCPFKSPCIGKELIVSDIEDMCKRLPAGKFGDSAVDCIGQCRMCLDNTVVSMDATKSLHSTPVDYYAVAKSRSAMLVEIEAEFASAAAKTPILVDEVSYCPVNILI